MRSFSTQLAKTQTVSHELLQTLGALREYRGKQDLYKNQAPQVLDSLQHVAIVQSTESSNRIEGVTAKPERVRALVEERTTPTNRNEAEISGYRDVLNTIHSNHRNIPFTPNVVLQLHQDLYQFTGQPGGRWKTVENEISEILPNGSKRIRFKPLSPLETPDAMERLHEVFNDAWERREVDHLLLINSYVLDFLCIHPFLDGNGRVSRLLTLLLLYRADYEVGHYISLEKEIEQSKETYYEALELSSRGWHQGTQSLAPWWEYASGILLASYRKFETRVNELSRARGSKTARVHAAIELLGAEFSIREVEQECPSVGIDLIRRILRREQAEGRLEKVGGGPKTKWRRKS